MKAYKGTNLDLTCIGFQFEIGKRYSIPDNQPLVMCENGFHSCTNLFEIQEYYNPKCSRFFEVEIKGEDYLKEAGSSKLCSRHITLVRELTFRECMQGLNKTNNNELSFNLGFGNHGNNNDGNYNDGNNNDGNYNDGNDNNGNYNHGDDNNGNYNDGNDNNGNYNDGNNNNGNNNDGNNNLGNNNRYSNFGYNIKL